MVRNFILCVLLSSCVSIPEPQVIEKERSLSPFPILPTTKEYSRKPIIESTANNFVVSDEFVENSLKYKKFVDKISEWKNLNKIR